MLTKLEEKLVAALTSVADLVPTWNQTVRGQIADALSLANLAEGGFRDSGEAAVQAFIENGKQPHELFLNMEGDTLPGFEDDAKPFCRFERFSDRGDPSVGIPSVDCWQLSEKQDGTLLGDFIAKQNAEKQIEDGIIAVATGATQPSADAVANGERICPNCKALGYCGNKANCELQAEIDPRFPAAHYEHDLKP